MQTSEARTSYSPCIALLFTCSAFAVLRSGVLDTEEAFQGYENSQEAGLLITTLAVKVAHPCPTLSTNLRESAQRLVKIHNLPQWHSSSLVISQT